MSILCAVATLFLLSQSDLAARPDVSIPRWFGLTIDYKVLLASVKVLALNTILFSGEIFQLYKGMHQTDYDSL